MTRYTDMSVGDTVPVSATAAMLAEDLPEPEWHILTTAPQAELPAIAWLERNGVPDAWCPTETRWKKVPRGRRKRVEYQAPIAPRYVFVPFPRRPVWHVLFERARGKLTGVVAKDGVPLCIPEAQIAQMEQVPKRLAAIKEREDRRRRVGPGDRVHIASGPLQGWTVEVARIHAGIAYFVAPLLGEREVAVGVDRLRKVQA